ncbi:MAG TPA: TetR/AcrR family transcriptional regulator [Longimicrobium sp.]|nr:TetR/AcrR family transcriptional regulator [Longimicrobium sp.]
MNKGQRTKRDIVDRALSLAGDVGLENVTLGTLASELRLSKSGLFAHFNSKEALQLAVLGEAVERFTAAVIRPALEAPRGEPRLSALFERWLAWIDDSKPDAAEAVQRSGGRCIFMALSQEYDDRPGELHDAVAQSQRDWRAFVTHAAKLAISQHHFAAGADAEQFAFELVGIGMSYQQTTKLLADPAAGRRARAAFEALMARYRSS